MNLKVDFDRAVEEVKSLPKKPADSDLLKLYALFKQATLGDAQGSRPGLFDLVGRKKFDAWSSLKGKTTEDAINSYIALVKQLKESTNK